MTDLGNPGPPPADDLGAIGVTGLRQYGGWIDEEFLIRLKGQRGVQTYREMSDNDAVIGAALYVIHTYIQQVKWWAQPADETSQAAKDEAAFLESCITDMSHTWEDLIDEILSMMVYGWAYFETVYKLRKGEDSTATDGRFGWRKIEIRAQDSLDRWQMDNDGGIRGMWQRADSTIGLMSPAMIPIEKALLFRTRRHKNNPEGRSLLRNAVRPWTFVKRIQEIEAIGIERDLVGMPTFEVPPEILATGATGAQRDIRNLLERLVQQIRRDEREGLLIPASEITSADGVTRKTGYKLSLLQGAGKRQIDTSQVITRYEQRILMSMLSEFVMLGMQDVGSRSLASSKTSTFAMSLKGFLDRIGAVFNRFAIPRLFALNGVPKELQPTLVHGDIEAPPLDEVAQYITSLANAGFALSTNKPLERKLLGYADLPPPEEDNPTPE